MEYIVVIGNAKTGLAFVGPFDTEAAGQDYITNWKTTHSNVTTPTGVVELCAPDNVHAGKNL